MPSFQAPTRSIMRKLILALLVLATAALVAPLTAQGHRDEDDGLRVRLERPVTFSDPTPGCPEGTIAFGISSNGKIGSGRNCVQEVVLADCPPAVEALFCQEARALMALRLGRGSIDAEVSIFEIWTCGDPECLTLAVDQRWEGRVTQARRKFRELEGGSVSGGGTVVFDAMTFDVLGLDEVLVIGEADDEEEDDDD